MRHRCVSLHQWPRPHGALQPLNACMHAAPMLCDLFNICKAVTNRRFVSTEFVCAHMRMCNTGIIVLPCVCHCRRVRAC